MQYWMVLTAPSLPSTLVFSVVVDISPSPGNSGQTGTGKTYTMVGLESENIHQTGLVRCTRLLALVFHDHSLFMRSMSLEQ